MAILKGAVKSISLEQNLIILEQLKKCICKINKKGTGFFCFIPYGNKNLPVLITAAHIISVKEELKEISLEINNSVKIIELNGERKAFSDKELNISNKEKINEAKNRTKNKKSIESKVIFREISIMLIFCQFK